MQAKKPGATIEMDALFLVNIPNIVCYATVRESKLSASMGGYTHACKCKRVHEGLEYEAPSRYGGYPSWSPGSLHLSHKQHEEAEVDQGSQSRI